MNIFGVSWPLAQAYLAIQFILCASVYRKFRSFTNLKDLRMLPSRSAEHCKSRRLLRWVVLTMHTANELSCKTRGLCCGMCPLLGRVQIPRSCSIVAQASSHVSKHLEQKQTTHPPRTQMCCLHDLSSCTVGRGCIRPRPGKDGVQVKQVHGSSTRYAIHQYAIEHPHSSHAQPQTQTQRHAEAQAQAPT